MDQSLTEKELERQNVQQAYESLRQEYDNYLKLQQSAMAVAVAETGCNTDASSDDAEAVKERLERELQQQLKLKEDADRNYREKSEQLSALERAREEADVCVSQLRSEVTSLQVFSWNTCLYLIGDFLFLLIEKK